MSNEVLKRFQEELLEANELELNSADPETKEKLTRILQEQGTILYEISKEAVFKYINEEFVVNLHQFLGSYFLGFSIEEAFNLIKKDPEKYNSGDLYVIRGMSYTGSEYYLVVLSTEFQNILKLSKSELAKRYLELDKDFVNLI